MKIAQCTRKHATHRYIDYNSRWKIM